MKNESDSTFGKSSEIQKSVSVEEYADGDTSDEEDVRNTVGNIPMHWYDAFNHIGYDVEGNKIMKPISNDEIDEFLNKMDDPNYWRTVTNKMTGQKVVLSDEDLTIIKRLQSGKYPTGENQFQPFEDLYSHETMHHPVTHHPPHKRSFIPSKIEKAKVSKLVHAIKMGWLKPRLPRLEKDPFCYDMWEDGDTAEDIKRLQHYIPAPKRKLPGHEESYIPPKEYLFTEEEEEKWKEQDPEERKLDFIPKRHTSLRLVPSYTSYVQEWFNRCLDLYLCPRQQKMRVNVDPNDLIPKLPKPKDLQPFPSLLAIVYTGHTGLIRCICVESTGQFMASGSDDKTIKVWEVLTGRCLVTVNTEEAVKSLAWCPNPSLALLIAAVGDKVYIINSKVGDKLVVSNTDMLLNTLPDNQERTVALWTLPNEEQKKCGIRLIITHTQAVKQVVFHAKGDYFACLVSEVGYKSLVIHQLSKFRSQRHTAFNPAVLDEVDSNGDIIRTWCSPGVLIKALLSLAHGNADCERGFSENKNILESRSNLGAASINGIRRIKSELKKCGSIKNFNINPKLLSSVKTSWRRYENRTKAEKNIEKKEKEKISADNNLLQLKSEEQQLKKRLESTQILLKKAELSITDGLKHKSFTDVECGQVLLKDCNKKTSEIMILLEKNRKAQSEYSNVNPEKRKRRMPFKKVKGSVEKISFHPLRPIFFVATRKHVRVFNLIKQEMTKVITGNCQWISSMAVHPQGDNLLLGSYDCRLSWFDLELSTKPYKTLKHHKKAIRAVAYHPRYPLFASASDDGSVIICHGMVYSDLLQNAMIVPLKNLKNHKMCLDICFHPKKPWIFTGSDKDIRLYS